MGSGILRRVEKVEARTAPDRRPVFVWDGDPIPETDRPVIVVGWQEDAIVVDTGIRR
jgi:hypothetical protein